MNGLVAVITFGIYTPMEIVVTCANAPGASLVTSKEDFVTAMADGRAFLVETRQSTDPALSR